MVDMEIGKFTGIMIAILLGVLDQQPYIFPTLGQQSSLAEMVFSEKQYCHNFNN